MTDLKYDVARDELAAFVPPAVRRLLDVGCGVGRYADSLGKSRPEIEVWAVEPDPANAAAAGDRVHKLIEAPFPDAATDLPVGAFDVVTFNDVLEHLTDPAQALEATRPLLAPGGRVVASIPNVRHRSVVWPLVRHGRWTYEETGPLDRTHLRFFTRQTMRALFADLGWHVESVCGINMRWNWWEDGPGRKVRWLRRVAGERLDEFLYVQYVVTAVPPEADR